jgi:hypothetical protein
MSFPRRPRMQTHSIAPRRICPSCGRRGLGNVRVGRHSWDSDFRDCRYCGDIHPVARTTEGEAK